MRLLIAAATEREIAPFLDFMNQQFSVIAPYHFCKNNLEVVVCITGVGTLLSAFSLSSAFAHIKPHFALQAGIGGAFNRELPLGSLVVVRSEMPGDLGVEDGNSIKSVFDLGLIQADEPPFVNGRLINPMRDFPFHLPFPSVNSLTVNMASGNEVTIQKRITKFSCDIENMEGASFHYICLKHQVPFLQIRTISNYVEVRDTSKWKLEEAIHTLNEWMKDNITIQS